MIPSTQILDSEIPELLESLEKFCLLLKHKPFENWAGLRGVSAFALYWYLQKIKPDLVIEVGVWKGFSTWIIENALPNAKIICLDPMFFLEEAIKNGSISSTVINSNVIGSLYRTKKAQYFSNDFSCLEMQELLHGSNNPCVFFDDHQHKLPRLKQAKEYGIKNIIFDDNQPFPYTHKSLELYLRDPSTQEYLSNTIKNYQVFPALWDTSIAYTSEPFELKGIGIPQTENFRPVFDDRHWHSFVTWVQLK